MSSCSSAARPDQRKVQSNPGRAELVPTGSRSAFLVVTAVAASFG